MRNWAKDILFLQVIYVPKYKNKEVKAIMELQRQEDEHETLDEKDGRRYDAMLWDTYVTQVLILSFLNTDATSQGY